MDLKKKSRPSNELTKPFVAAEPEPPSIVVDQVKLTPKKAKTTKGAGAVGFLLLLGIVVVVIVAINSAGHKSTDAAAAANATAQPTAQAAARPAAQVATRKVTGTATTLGAGTFTGGKDVAVGLYNVTTTSGQSGNFIVSGTDSYDEVLGVSDGLGVPMIRAQISTGDSIQISGLSQAMFTPVTTPFVTTPTVATLYAGTFTVGQDIGAGRYVATPGSGQSGNFIVSGADSYDEILGGSSADGGVPHLTVNLTNGDVISISSLSQVTLTPSN